MKSSINIFILICGVSGAGKTTYSKRFKDVIHLDDYIGYTPDVLGTNCYQKVKEISKNNDYVVEGIYHTVSLRKELLEIKKDKYKKCIFIDVSKETLKKRHMFAYPQFEPPTLDEGWDEILIIRDNEEVLIKKEREEKLNA